MTEFMRFAGERFRRAGGRAFVILTSDGAGDQRRTYTREVAIGTTGDTAVAPFRFVGIPHGNYRATVHTDTFHRWQQSSIPVRPPQGLVEFVCRDDVAERDLELNLGGLCLCLKKNIFSLNIMEYQRDSLIGREIP